MKQKKTSVNPSTSKAPPGKESKIKPRVLQRPFKNEELFIGKIKKDYEKYKLQPKVITRLP